MGIKTGLLLSIFLCSGVLLVTSPGVASSDPYIGCYEGVFHSTGRPDFPAKGLLTADAKDHYRVTLKASSTTNPSDVDQIELQGEPENSQVTFSGLSQMAHWTGSAANGALKVQRSDVHYGGSFELMKVDPHSPTEKKAPPPGAVVLLPYQEGTPPDASAWTNPKWKSLPDGCWEITPESGSNFTHQKFGDLILHLEFWIPHKPEIIGQGRSNSGVYLQSRYEVQVLDSFGVFSGSGDCGAIYEISTPKTNACFPPECWQTYDMTFRAPRLNPDGTVKEFPKLSVVLNGVSIQEDILLNQMTPADIAATVAEKDALLIQDHGFPVRYRNIWVVPLEEAAK